MITVTQRDRMSGHIKEIGVYTNEDFAGRYGHDLWKFSTDHSTYFNEGVRIDGWIVSETKFKFVAYNENDKILSVDHLVGIVNAFWKKRRPFYYTWKNKYDRGARKPAYGSFRHIKTFPERKWTHAWDDEDFAPNNGFARGSRSGRTLPDPWDDYWAWNQKSWKKQSKRKHQYKPVDKTK